METGIFDGVSFEDYKKIPAINKSGLDEFARSPLHYWAAHIDPEREEQEITPSMRLGHAIHAAILEIPPFEKTYTCLPKGNDRRTKDGKAAYELACSTGLIPLNFDDYTCAKTIAKNVRSSSSANIIFATGKPERTFIWQDPLTKIFCKARCDWLTDDFLLIADLKSARDASPTGFKKACGEYNYHRQAAWYLWGLNQITGKDALFAFPVYETDPPYAAAFYYASPEMIGQGEREIYKLLAQYGECFTRNKWPGYSDELQPIDLPNWRRDDKKTKEMELY